MSKYGVLKPKRLMLAADDQDWMIEHKRLLKARIAHQSDYNGNDPMAFHKALMQDTPINSGFQTKRFAVDLSA